MTDRRFEPDDLAELAGLAPGDPRRQALESDARLRARVRALEDFENPGAIPEGARVADAEARLAETLERELGVPVARAERPASERVPVSEMEWRRRAPAGRRRGFLGPLWVPSLAAAAVLLVVAGAWFMVSTRQPQSPIMRGTTPGPTGALVGSTTPIARGVRLEWTAHPEAQTYVITILAPDLTEILALGPVTETHVDLAFGALNETQAPEGQVLWRVRAIRGDDEVGRSETMTLELPR